MSIVSIKYYPQVLNKMLKYLSYKRKISLRYVVFIIVFFNQCNDVPETQFSLITNTGINFNNINEFRQDYNVFNYRNYYNGGGVAIGDINNDQLPDVFFTANQVDNALYLNKGNLQFENITQTAGLNKKKNVWSTGVVMADVNHDGWLDIYVCNAGNMLDSSLRKHNLYINNHDLTFTDKAAEYGLEHPYYTTHASFFDYDLDGDLDCFFVDNSPIPVNTINNKNSRNIRAENADVGNILRYGGDHLFKNEQGRFVEVSAQAGIHGSLISLGLGATVSDINNDGYPDIYVSNDFFERDYLYINQKNGTFKDEFEQHFQHLSLASMGADIADINNDGFVDIFTTDMLPQDNYRLKTTTAFDNYDVYRLKLENGFYHQFMQNALQLNDGAGNFKEIAQYAGVEASDWSWGALFFDADNDGFNDIYVCNGIKHDLTNQDFLDYLSNDVIKDLIINGKKEEVKNIVEKMPSIPVQNKMFHNSHHYRFEDRASAWGLGTSSFSNGAAYGDLDNDGDLDLVVNNLNQPAFVFRNNTQQKNKSHFFKCRLSQQNNNTFAIGSKVRIYSNNKIISKEVYPARGFQSSMDYNLVLGLGENSTIDSLIISWPDLTQTTIFKPTTDSFYIFNKEKLNQEKIISTNYKNEFLSEINNPFKKHEENDHVDFYIERGIPKMLSYEGPKMAVADINKDGLEDVFIGGTALHSGTLYLQNKAGEFMVSEQADIHKFAGFEDVALSFFDANKDGYPDLFIGAGGNAQLPQSGFLEHRLFINDKKGHFKIQPNSFPKNNYNIAVAKAYDYDNDGDLDLFVGARSRPFLYGLNPQNAIYKNDGSGHFTDVCADIAPDILELGLVTDALWTNQLFGSNPSLVIVGEWMSPRFFMYKNGKFSEQKSNLNNYYGWWQCLQLVDWNQDGQLDLFLGNIGENSYLRPDTEHPIKMWINDYDQNQMKEKIITRTDNGKDFTVFLKRDMDEQLPMLKKKNLKFEQFAKKPIQELFNAEQLKSAQQKIFNYDPSIIAINKGQGNFILKKLPPEIQFSCVNAVTIKDVNNDHFPDLIMGGNQIHFIPQFGRLDASFGNLVLNDKKDSFTVVSDIQSGLHIIGQVNDLQCVKTSTKDIFVFLINNEKPKTYSLKTNLK